MKAPLLAPQLDNSFPPHVFASVRAGDGLPCPRRFAIRIAGSDTFFSEWMKGKKRGLSDEQVMDQALSILSGYHECHPDLSSFQVVHWFWTMPACAMMEETAAECVLRGEGLAIENLLRNRLHR